MPLIPPYLQSSIAVILVIVILKLLNDIDKENTIKNED